MTIRDEGFERHGHDAASGHEIAPYVSIAVMPPFVRLTRWLYKLAGSDLRGGYFYTETRGLQ